MKLNLTQIKDITLGAARVEERADGFNFFRFTAEQEELYKNRREEFYIKSFCTSGVRLRFRTDSRSLFLKTEVFRASTRNYFSFDLFINGQRVDSLNNFSNVELPKDYTQHPFPLGEFSKTFSLAEGEKEVEVYFPWSVKAIVKEIALDDGACIIPVKPEKKLLCFGDSITHGYDALYPSNKYASQLADFLGAEEYNKAIGAEVFCSELAQTKEDFVPDLITVAYGTNDWSKCTKENFLRNCRGFFSNLSKTYPNTKIIAITPIWRKDKDEPREFGEFASVPELIRELCADLPNVSVIYGYNFVPKDEDFFADLRLHPNDNGFAHYFKNLLTGINA